MTTGYRGAWTGVLRVGIWGEPAATVLARAGLVVGGVLAVLLALTWPVVLWLGRRLGAPIKVLAQDFEGVMRHAPLHIVIEDGDGVIARSSEAFRADFGLTTARGVRAADLTSRSAPRCGCWCVVSLMSSSPVASRWRSARAAR